MITPAHASRTAFLAPTDVTTVENPEPTAQAQFNPKEIGIDKSIPWQHRIVSADIFDWANY